MASAMSAGCLISPEPLLEQFNCAICLNIMKDVWVTTCFHRFCENCIKESINAAHRCPLCNKALQQDEIQRDAQYNSLLETIDKCIQFAEDQKAKSFADQIVRQIGDTSMRAKLENLFRETLVASLADHLTSENDMRSRYKRKKAEIEEAYNREMVQLQEQKLPKEQYTRAAEIKTKACVDAIKKLDEEIRNVQNLFIDAYKSHLNKHVSNFAAVPTQVRVTLWKENRLYQLKDRQYLMKLLRPEDRMEELLPCLHELVTLQNDNISKFGETIFFTCVDALDDLSEQSVVQRLHRMQESVDDDADENLLTVSRNCRPILEHKLSRGTLVVIHGDILLESEVPKKCFIEVFYESPHQRHLVDYFACHDCRKDGKELRWICRSCAAVCHKNHNVTPLIFGNEAKAPKCDCRKFCLIYKRN